MSTDQIQATQCGTLGFTNCSHPSPVYCPRSFDSSNSIKLKKPLAFHPVEGARGWMAEIDLSWSDLSYFGRIPIAASWRIEQIDGIDTLIVELGTSMRSPPLHDLKEHIDARMTENGLLLHLDQGRVIRSRSGSGRLNIQTTTSPKA